MMAKLLACALAVGVTQSTGVQAAYIDNPNHFPRRWFEHRSQRLIEEAWKQLCTARPRALDKPCGERRYYEVRGIVFPSGCAFMLFGERWAQYSKSEFIETAEFKCDVDGRLGLEQYQ
jgi:hypothetical protein